MKKKLVAIIILCLLLCLFIFSACNIFGEDIKTRNNMTYRLYDVTDKSPEELRMYEKYYRACIMEDMAETCFILPYIDDVPVLQLGGPNSFWGGVFVYCDELENLYIPGTILNINRAYPDVYVEKHAQNFNAFYCGAVIDLAILSNYNIKDKCYVPAEKYEEFKSMWGISIESYNHTTNGSPDENLFKANIKYYLNAEDLVDYYYVDFVESGKNIVNIPPNPERKGYTFDGWYIEKEGYTKWNFNSVPLLTATEFNPDGEFNLYAKWIKK